MTSFACCLRRKTRRRVEQISTGRASRIYSGSRFLPITRTFIERYASGQIGGWLSVLNPFSKNPNISLTEQFFHLLASISQLKEEFPESCRFPLLFEPGWPVALGNFNGRRYLLLAGEGVSGLWSVVVLGRHSDPGVFPFPFSQFLAKCITEEISCFAIRSFWRAGKAEFSPYQV